MESKIAEYRSLVMRSRDSQSGDMADDQLLALLVKESDWSLEGAQALLSLARNYGAFMLLNAAALATGLDIEDGELGF